MRFRLPGGTVASFFRFLGVLLFGEAPILFPPYSTSSMVRGGGVLPDFLFLISFPCPSADHK